jgi:hypothetical protein
LQHEKFLTLNLPEFKKNLAVAVASASTAKSASFGGSVQIQSLPLGLEDTTPPGYRIVGTDSIVLTVVEIRTPVPFEFKWLLNLTAAAVVQLMDGETINIGESNTHLQLFGKGCSVYASKPVQAYPNFDMLLVKQPHIRIKLNPQAWLNALRTIEPLIDEEKDKGAISLTFKDNVVYYRSVGIGNVAEDEAEYEQVEPDPFFDPKEFDVKLTSKYLSGFLNKAGDEAFMGITDGPIRFESGNIIVLTMPVKK